MNGALLARLALLAPAGCRLALRPLNPADVDLLAPEEGALIPTAGPGRRVEFATGRALLHELFPTSGPIERSAAGAPLLLAGWVGSLAHDRVAALAVMASDTDFLAVGIDLEHVRPDSDDDELRAAIVRPDDAALSATAAFVVKEAAYKAYSAVGGPMVGPLDVRIDTTGAVFRAHFPAAGDVQALVVEGVFVGDTECWAALAAIRR